MELSHCRASPPAIRAAERSVELAGWFFSPEFELTRGHDREALVGAPPSDRRTRSRGASSGLGGGASTPVPARPAPGRSGDQPTLLTVRAFVSRPIAGSARSTATTRRSWSSTTVAFVGGIDLTDSGGDRFDGSGHPSRRGAGWHDAATRLEGPAVADVAAPLPDALAEVTGERLTAAGPPAPAGASPSAPAHRPGAHLSARVPRGDFSILEAYSGLSRRAPLVYLENQFLWSPEIVDILAASSERPPSPTTSGWSSCCPARRRAAPTTRAGSSAR